MSIIISISGEENTGKSFGRQKMRRPDQQFVVMSDAKSLNMKAPKQRAVFAPKGLDYAKAKAFYDQQFPPDTDKRTLFEEDLITQDLDNIQLYGNYVNTDILGIGNWLLLVNRFAPQIKEVHVEDIAHFISNETSTDTFRGRTDGQEAYARYDDLAAEMVKGVYRRSTQLRDDLVVLIYHHTQFDDNSGSYKIFVPAGNLLKSRYRPEGYFANGAESVFITEADKPDLEYEERYRFIVRRTGPHNGRNVSAFPKIQDIPNDTQLLVDAVRHAEFQTLDHTPPVEDLFKDRKLDLVEAN